VIEWKTDASSSSVLAISIKTTNSIMLTAIRASSHSSLNEAKCSGCTAQLVMCGFALG